MHWRVGRLSWRFLWTEARSASIAIIALAAVMIFVAELIDVTARVPSGLTWLFRSDLEEPLELLGAVLPGAGNLARYCRDRGAGGRRGP